MEDNFMNLKTNFSLLSEFKSLQKRSELTDTFLVGMDGKVAVHSVILLQYSTFWNNMISRAKDENKTVILPQHSLADLMVFVEKLYSLSSKSAENMVVNAEMTENQQNG